MISVLINELVLVTDELKFVTPRSAGLYDPSTETWTITGNTNNAQQYLYYQMEKY
jgi:hypothetical protein